MSDDKYRNLNILVIEDDADDYTFVCNELEKNGFESKTERILTREEMVATLNCKKIDIILSDYNLPRFSAPEALQTLKDSGLDIPFIVISGAVGEEEAVKVMKAGAHDYILKDSLVRLPEAIKRELNEAKIRRELRLKEIVLQESERQFRELLENIVMISAILDTSGKIEFCNNYLLKLIKKQSNEVIGANWFKLLVPESAQPLAKELFSLTITKDNLVPAFEYDIILAEKERHHIVWKYTLIRNKNGEITAVAYIGDDITESKRLERENHRVQEQIFNLNKTISLARLAVSTATKINDPLLVIKKNIAIISEHTKDKNIHSLLMKQRIAANTIAEAILELQDYAKLDLDKVESMESSQAIEQSLQLVEQLLKRDGIFLERDLRAKETWVSCNLVKFQQIIMNLFLFARDSLAGIANTQDVKKLIKIETDNHNDYLVININDNGLGLTQTELRQVFDPFFKPYPKSVGNGLWISKNVLQSWGGSIEVESAFNKGNRFTIKIACSDSKEKKEKIEKNTNINIFEFSVAEMGLDQLKGRVLLIDNDDYTREGISNYLGLMGLGVFEATGINDAIQKLKNDIYDFVIIDASTNKKNEDVLIGQIREFATPERSKIIEISDHIGSRIAIVDPVIQNKEGDRSNNKRADAYLGKPFNMAELVKIMSKLQNYIEQKSS
ncbi:MAG: response regulator [Oligoflexia bacterium]|nr:response regulator [Oligoflexia bacterium]